MIAMRTLSTQQGVEMNPFQSPVSASLNLMLLPLAIVILAVFAVRERLTPPNH